MMTGHSLYQEQDTSCFRSKAAFLSWKGSSEICAGSVSPGCSLSVLHSQMDRLSREKNAVMKIVFSDL